MDYQSQEKRTIALPVSTKETRVKIKKKLLKNFFLIGTYNMIVKKFILKIALNAFFEARQISLKV